jgi:hypothetical protein
MTTLSLLDGGTLDLSDDRIVLNYVILPWEYNPHNVRLWVICNEYGALGAVWASHEQDALDALIDNDLGAGILIDEADADDESPRLGNAGEPCNLDYCQMSVVRLDDTKDCRLLCRIAEARGANRDTLDF